MDTKEILGHIRSFEYKELYKQQLALKAIDELDRMIPHFKIDEIPDEELDEESLSVKKRYEEMLETWRKGGVVEMGKRKATDSKDVGKTPENRLTEFEKFKEEWNKGMANRFLIRLKAKGIITAKGDVYDWKIDQEHGYSYRLYVYFVYHASIKLGWTYGTKKVFVHWKKFNIMFPNVSKNQSSRNQDLIAIKSGEYPALAWMIDEVLKK